MPDTETSQQRTAEKGGVSGKVPAKNSRKNSRSSQHRCFSAVFRLFAGTHLAFFSAVLRLFSTSGTWPQRFNTISWTALHFPSSLGQGWVAKWLGRV